MDIHLPLRDDKLVKLQESDPHTKQLRKQWENKNLDQNMYTCTPWENNILKRKLVDNRLLYTPIVVPDILKDFLLILAHDKQATTDSEEHTHHWKTDTTGKAWRNQYTKTARTAKSAKNTTSKLNS